MDDAERQLIAKVIDGKISELEKELAEAQKVVMRLGTLQITLNSLRQTRAVLLGAPLSQTPPQQPFTQVIIRPAPVTATPPVPPIAALLPHRLRKKADPRLMRSVGSLVLETLKEINGPTHLPMLLQRLRNKGKTVSYRALSSVLSQYVTRGLVQRVGPAVYILPGGEKPSGSGTPTKAST